MWKLLLPRHERSSHFWLLSQAGRRSFASVVQVNYPYPHKATREMLQVQRADLGWSIWRRSMPISQKPTVASSIGVNFSLTMLSIVTSALATSALTMYPPPNM